MADDEKVQIMLYAEKPLADALKALADKEERSVTKTICRLLRQSLGIAQEE